MELLPRQMWIVSLSEHWNALRHYSAITAAVARHYRSLGVLAHRHRACTSPYECLGARASVLLVRVSVWR